MLVENTISSRRAGGTLEASGILVVVLSIFLTACGSDGGDDLDKFMAEAGNDMRAKIEPLPEVKPYTPFQYNADGALNDPFKPRKAKASATGAVRPDLNRPREPLEAFPLESLKFVGAISRPKLKYGLIKTPEDTVQQVRIGNYIGQNFGMVTEITESGLTLKEIVQDETTGDWVERIANINLQE